jgi:poly-gamma-glutamate capsule biosynthesis protein CapA/YwtB (metallophosphatase superfamily)
MRNNSSGIVLAVGDIGPDRPDPNESFVHVRDVLSRGDVVFGQLELPLTEGGVRLPQARHAVRGSPSTASALKEAGFSVISFASNHCMDWGAPAMLETLDRLRGAGLHAIGAGKDLAEARKPSFADTPGGRIAFLAYCSILPMDYWATERRAGCAPMRAFTQYEQIEHDQPGTPCRIHTHAHREDLQALREDLVSAKREADVVAISFHWGIHFIPGVIADYQREVAHAAIDAGADLILGHHAHILKGIEVYRGKAIFYSLGNFAIDLRMTAEHANAKSFKEIQVLNPDWKIDLNSLFNCPPHSRRTLVVQATLEAGQIQSVGFIPAYIDNMTAVPETLRPADVRFLEVTRYLEEISSTAGFSTRFSPFENHVRVMG